MKKLAILGLGHIGKYVQAVLSQDSNFTVTGYDITTGHDLSDVKTLDTIMAQCDGVLVTTPFNLNVEIAKACDRHKRDYFDLTESVSVTDTVKSLKNARFVTQCGLAPGMVSIIANKLASAFEQVLNINIRVGALPINSHNHMGYYRTWNTQGLINEYINPCPSLRNGKLVELQPLTEMETVTLNGLSLEAATTSGGLGSLAESWQNRASNVTYKTLRYPGHWKLMQFLKDDLGLAENFETYVHLFNSSVPMTNQDLVYILITVEGMIDGVTQTRQYSKIVLHDDVSTAIQRTTGCGVMAVLDSWANGGLDGKLGWIRQEELDFDSIWNSKYSECYR